ncbi:Uncharacterized protein FWK35_00027050 [Aphis craccivora]|uniref:Uncharacterized protein n=1 Tax=Aphis craccivora TaxID=307492 RepID=A0A6G0YDC2_APHCR|nr:Uncharacterized protein FWK35_00027050 [Aphis craccivora]
MSSFEEGMGRDRCKFTNVRNTYLYILLFRIVDQSLILPLRTISYCHGTAPTGDVKKSLKLSLALLYGLIRYDFIGNASSATITYGIGSPFSSIGVSGGTSNVPFSNAFPNADLANACPSEFRP